MRKKITCLAGLLMTGMLAVSGCGLLPAEEEPRKIRIETESIENEYDLATCEVRDVVLTDTITCQYKQLLEENLSFDISGKRVAFVYVSEGDEVKAGDLLVKLDIEEYEAGIITLNEKIEKDELLIKQTDEKIDFYEKRIESDGTGLLQKEDYLSKLQKVREKKREYQDEIDYSRTLIENYQAEIDGGRLYAGIDGTVSYIQEGLVGSTTIANLRVMTLMDSAVCAFQATDKDACGYIKQGDRFTVNVNGVGTRETTATSIEPETGKLVFELDEPDFSISVGTRGSIDVVLGTREQVLSIPRVSVYSADDYYYVYVINESGVREMKKISVGLIGNNMVEVTDGLNLSDSVILR